MRRGGKGKGGRAIIIYHPHWRYDNLALLVSADFVTFCKTMQIGVETALAENISHTVGNQ